MTEVAALAASEAHATTEAAIYRRHLQDVAGALRQDGADFRIVGGVAVNGYINRSVSPRRQTGEVRDLDCIVLNKSQQELVPVTQAIREIKATAQDNLFPSVTLNGLVPLPDGKQTIPSLYSRISQKDGIYHLVYNDLAMPLDSAVFAPHDITLIGDIYPSVAPETLLHLYLARGGYVKPKDMEKLRGLARYIAKSPTEGITNEMLDPFHQFAAKMRQEHPVLTDIVQGIEFLEHRFKLHKILPYGSSGLLQRKKSHVA